MLPVLRREHRRVQRNLSRARKAGCPATLTFGQWLTVLYQHNWRCAYCGGPYECLEHRWPLSQGGATSAANCVPACHACNDKRNETFNTAGLIADSIQAIIANPDPTLTDIRAHLVATCAPLLQEKKPSHEQIHRQIPS